MATIFKNGSALSENSRLLFSPNKSRAYRWLRGFYICLCQLRGSMRANGNQRPIHLYQCRYRDDIKMESAKKECMANIKSCEMGKCGISTIDFCQFLWYNNRVRDYTRRPRSERSEQTIAWPCATLRSDIMAGGHGIMTERVLLFDEQWEEWAWGNSIQTIRYKLRCQKGTSAM